jgi:hypothetical protein
MMKHFGRSKKHPELPGPADGGFRAPDAVAPPVPHRGAAAAAAPPPRSDPGVKGVPAGQPTVAHTHQQRAGLSLRLHRPEASKQPPVKPTAASLLFAPAAPRSPAAGKPFISLMGAAAKAGQPQQPRNPPPPATGVSLASLFQPRPLGVQPRSLAQPGGPPASRMGSRQHASCEAARPGGEERAKPTVTAAAATLRRGQQDALESSGGDFSSSSRSNGSGGGSSSTSWQLGSSDDACSTDDSSGGASLDAPTGRGAGKRQRDQTAPAGVGLLSAPNNGVAVGKRAKTAVLAAPAAQKLKPATEKLTKAAARTEVGVGVPAAAALWHLTSKGVIGAGGTALALAVLPLSGPVSDELRLNLCTPRGCCCCRRAQLWERMPPPPWAMGRCH